MRIEADRIYLRRFELSDREGLFSLHREEAIMKFTRKGRAISADESFENLKTIISENERDYPLGKWACFLKEDDSFLGWFGFWPSEFDNEPELGFMIAIPQWGKGYTTEAAKAILDYYDAHKVHALTTLDNFPSQRVLEKLGFELLKEDEESKHFVKVKSD